MYSQENCSKGDLKKHLESFKQGTGELIRGELNELLFDIHCFRHLNLLKVKKKFFLTRIVADFVELALEKRLSQLSTIAAKTMMMMMIVLMLMQRRIKMIAQNFFYPVAAKIMMMMDLKRKMRRRIEIIAQEKGPC